MDGIAQQLRDLAVANRILANEGVVDAFGHISIRHPSNPERFLLSRSRSPELVEPEDIMEFDLDCNAIGDERSAYLERFIHGPIYAARPDVQSVVHSHADEVLPYTITKEPLRPVIHVASQIGLEIPVWDIRERFGDTKLLVTTLEQGRDLARCLGNNNVALMRGHGFVSVGRFLVEAVKTAVYMPRNAQVLSEAKRFGEVTTLTLGEIEVRSKVTAYSNEMRRAWEYWGRRAGCTHLMGEAKPAGGE